MPDYSKSIIIRYFTLENNSSDYKEYLGTTTGTLLNKFKTDYRNYLKNGINKYYNYECFRIFDEKEFGYMIVENYPCQNRTHFLACKKRRSKLSEIVRKCYASLLFPISHRYHYLFLTRYYLFLMQLLLKHWFPFV